MTDVSILQLVWFLLIGILFIGYAILDGFDLGVGALHLFVRNDTDRRININAIAPVWDGNEVWLLTGGGALFAAFPKAYATIFSSFYLALVLLLTGLIFRAVSMEFRSKVDSQSWRKVWDIAFAFGSIVPSIIYGVAVGNLVRGIPLNSQQIFTGTFLGLLNPYAILCGILSLIMFTLHGAIYLIGKTEGEHSKSMAKTALRCWFIYSVMLVLVIVATFISAPNVSEKLLSRSLFYLSLVLLLASTLYIPVTLQAQKCFQAFLASSTSIASLLLIAGVGLFPQLVPSLSDHAHSLSASQASASEYTLKVMTIIASIGMPLVLCYTIIIYRIFKGKVVLNDSSY
ncbi:MAG: cytochrome d ubiquinol oxidase subunit II [Planctomycetes bacterium]|nr:cytochrome d ubiquinol oxidase subunit II [Planctomycetota bacterium]